MEPKLLFKKVGGSQSLGSVFSSPESDVSPRLKSIKRNTTLSIKDFDRITRKLNDKSNSLNGVNYLYDTDDEDEDSISDTTDSFESEIEEYKDSLRNFRQETFSRVVDDRKKKIRLGSQRVNLTNPTTLNLTSEPYKSETSPSPPSNKCNKNRFDNVITQN